MTHTVDEMARNHSELRAFLIYLTTERGLSDKTVLVYSQRLRCVNEHLAKIGKSISDATPQELQACLKAELEAGRHARGVQHIYHTLRAWLKFQATCGRDTRTALDFLEAPRVPRTLPQIPNQSEILKVLAAIVANRPNRMQQLRDTALYFVLYHGGLRAAEVTGLKVGDVTPEPDGTGSARITGKGSKDRVVRLSPATIGALQCYWFVRKAQPTEPALSTLKGRALKGPQTRTFVQKWRRWARIDRPLTTHTFRHACASHWLGIMTDQGMGGEALLHVQRQLGHSKLTTTEVYTHVNAGRDSRRQSWWQKFDAGRTTAQQAV